MFSLRILGLDAHSVLTQSCTALVSEDKMINQNGKRANRWKTIGTLSSYGLKE